jgi:hypothetical protein
MARKVLVSMTTHQNPIAEPFRRHLAALVQRSAKAFREKPESQIFAKRVRHVSVARASPLSDISG